MSNEVEVVASPLAAQAPYEGALAGVAGERIRQARTIFNLACSFAGAGALIILLGVVLLFVTSLAQATVTGAAGVVAETVSLLLFRLNKETNDRLDALARDLMDNERVDLAMGLIREIEDAGRRDQAMQELGQGILGHGRKGTGGVSKPEEAQVRVQRRAE